MSLFSESSQESGATSSTGSSRETMCKKLYFGVSEMARRKDPVSDWPTCSSKSVRKSSPRSLSRSGESGLPDFPSSSRCSRTSALSTGSSLSTWRPNASAMSSCLGLVPGSAQPQTRPRYSLSGVV
jgi:hypothetical protein